MIYRIIFHFSVINIKCSCQMPFLDWGNILWKNRTVLLAMRCTLKTLPSLKHLFWNTSQALEIFSLCKSFHFISCHSSIAHFFAFLFHFQLNMQTVLSKCIIIKMTINSNCSNHHKNIANWRLIQIQKKKIQLNLV